MWLGLVLFGLVLVALWFATNRLRAPALDRRATGAGDSVASLAPWPGSNDVVVADDTSTFHADLSGLAHESERGDTPASLWVVRNGPGTLYRLRQVDGKWATDPATHGRGGWVLRYPDGEGDVDAEGITLAGTSGEGVYVASERNDRARRVSRNSVLRFAPSPAMRVLRATHEWDLTHALPAVEPNAGLESIAWVPDSALVAANFSDASTGRPYRPSMYPEHGLGLFFVGLEANGMIYAFALNHATNAFVRVAAINSGSPAVMALEYDRETGRLWATCDDTCGNRASILEIDAGRFVVKRRYAPPSTLPNANNEGFAIGLKSECVGGRKPVFWADDGDTRGHSIRRGTITCGTAPLR